MVPHALGPSLQRRRRITQGEHHPVDAERFAVREVRLQRLNSRAAREARDLAEDALEPHVCGRRLFGTVQNVLQIIPVERARHEILGVGLRVQLARKAQEVQRVLRVGG